MTRTALVTINRDHHIIIRRDDYKSQAEFASDLRGNGYKVAHIWNGNLSDDEVSDWYFLNRK